MPPGRLTATATSARRIRHEVADLAKENLGAITLAPNESDIYQWRATLPGPAGSPYEGGVFEVDIRLPDDYPFSPPKLTFLTKVYHCNIAPSGAICLDLLKTAWSPALSLFKVILSLSSLLTDPNPADPLVPNIALEYKRNRKAHDQNARDWVKKYAQPKAADPTPETPPAPSASVSRASSSRPRATPRAVNGDLTPPAPIIGSRRSASSAWGGSGGNASEPISFVDDDDDDVQVLGESSSAMANGGGAAQSPRRSKRARVGGSTTPAGGADDVIVVDD